jgi:hypothetical protein
MLLPSNTPLDGEGCVCPWLNNELKDWVLKVQQKQQQQQLQQEKQQQQKEEEVERSAPTTINHSSTTPPSPLLFHPSTSYLMYRSSHLPSLDAFPHNPSTTTCCTSSGAM